MAHRERPPKARPSAYDSLIDAERDALIQAGRQPGRGDLIRALIEASALPPAEARRAVDSFIDRRGGFIPVTTATEPARTGWIDDLLDAERANAARDDRPVTRKTLIRAVRQASAIPPREARAAVADYLYRRGGQTPCGGRLWVVGAGLVGLTLASLGAWWLLTRG